METLKVLHYVKTDKAEYYVYNIKQVGNSNVSVAIVRDGEEAGIMSIFRDRKRILVEEIQDESIGMCGGDSWDTFVRHCLDQLYRYIRLKKEHRVIDIRTDHLEQALTEGYEN